MRNGLSHFSHSIFSFAAVFGGAAKCSILQPHTSISFTHCRFDTSMRIQARPLVHIRAQCPPLINKTKDNDINFVQTQTSMHVAATQTHFPQKKASPARNADNAYKEKGLNTDESAPAAILQVGACGTRRTRVGMPLLSGIRCTKCISCGKFDIIFDSYRYRFVPAAYTQW